MKPRKPKRMKLKNGIAKALAHPSFKQKVIPGKKHARESRGRYKGDVDKEFGQE